MGVIMTPFAWLRRKGAVALALALTIGRLGAQQADQMILGWSGQSELGYLRVELWTPDAQEPRASRLVIKCASLLGVTTHVGHVVLLPDDLRSEHSINQLFVATAEDMARNGRHGSPVVAAISVDGTLRLYAVGPCEFRARPSLKPLSG